MATKSPENARVERVDVVRGRRKAHLSIGEVEHKVLPLVVDAGGLEPEKEREPVQEVVHRVPCRVRGATEVAYGAEGGGGGTDLREAERGVVSEEVMDWDNVVNLLFLRPWGALIHCIIRERSENLGRCLGFSKSWFSPFCYGRQQRWRRWWRR